MEPYGPGLFLNSFRQNKTKPQRLTQNNTNPTKPNQTPLLTAAKEAGCKYANGLGMLLHQGAKSLEIWSGQSAPLESMREALKKAINHG